VITRGELGRPIVLGHRGASVRAVDNTLGAFRLAHQQGADGIEADLRFTADHVIVLHHDPEVIGVGTLIDMSFDEVRRRAPLIPTLNEMLAAAGDMLLDLEIKNDPRQPDFDPDRRMAHDLAAWVILHGLLDRVVVSSFDPGTTDAVRASGGLAVTGQIFDINGGPTIRFRELADRGHAYVIPHESSLRTDGARFIDAAHNRGLQVAVWGVNRADHFRRLSAEGVDAVITDDPQVALETVLEQS
jgi:glycerophosphoryl diester phosphodiesterase